MIKLLVYRTAPLALRPLAILMEGMLPQKPTLLALSLPIAMMALMLSSVPVHLAYYKARKNESCFGTLASQYRSGLGWLFLISVSTLLVVLFSPLFESTAALSVIVCLTFIIEKFSDESSRALEFRKNYLGWFLVQILRSGWVFIPLIIALWGGGYKNAYLVSVLLAATLSLFIFFRITGLLPSLGLSGLPVIKNNVVYFFGGFLPASYRQIPRIVIVKVYHEQAHAFLALAQLAQGLSVLFNVRFQIPYRKIIARKPMLFQKLMEPAMKQVLIVASTIALGYVAYPMYIEVSGMRLYLQMTFFLPIVVADAMVFAVLSSYLGYVQWLFQPKKASCFYLMAALLAVLIVSMLLAVKYQEIVNLSGIPIVTIGIGLIWLFMLKKRFFV
ncbi:hypothetical protein [Alloalcanivorax xenomutans]|uniref:hypothetical protein n=1 Tax=Alloalcanivorax xenomutans TaxID=1094342 RepID=UPI003BAAB632